MRSDGGVYRARVGGFGRIHDRNVRDVFEFFDLANEREARTFGAYGHFDVEMHAVFGSVDFQLEQVKAAAAGDTQDALEAAVGLPHPNVKRQRVHDATSSIISEFDLPGPTMGQTFASG